MSDNTQTSEVPFAETPTPEDRDEQDRMETFQGDLEEVTSRLQIPKKESFLTVEQNARIEALRAARDSVGQKTGLFMASAAVNPEPLITVAAFILGEDARVNVRVGDSLDNPYPYEWGIDGKDGGTILGPETVLKRDEETIIYKGNAYHRDFHFHGPVDEDDEESPV